MTLDRAIKRARELADEKQETFYVVKDFDEYEVADEYELEGYYFSCTIIEALEPN